VLKFKYRCSAVNLVPSMSASILVHRLEQVFPRTERFSYPGNEL